MQIGISSIKIELFKGQSENVNCIEKLQTRFGSSIPMVKAIIDSEMIKYRPIVFFKKRSPL